MSKRRTPTGPALHRPIRWEPVSKSGGGIRHLALLDAADELAFSRTVASAAPFVRRALGGESHANRVATWGSARGPVFEPWIGARRRWLREVRRLAREARWVGVTDARGCYPSIAPDTVVDRLRALGVPAESINEIESWLNGLHDAGVDGLPIGPAASALLADAVLSVGDDAVRATGVPHVRWVDDVAIFAPDRRTGARALEALRRSWAAVGLELHEDKTAVFTEADAARVHLGARTSSPVAPSTLR